MPSLRVFCNRKIVPGKLPLASSQGFNLRIALQASRFRTTPRWWSHVSHEAGRSPRSTPARTGGLLPCLSLPACWACRWKRSATPYVTLESSQMLLDANLLPVTQRPVREWCGLLRCSGRCRGPRIPNSYPQPV